VILLFAGLPLAGCREVEEEKASGYQPARLEEVKEDLKRVTFTAEGAERVGLRTAPVRQDGRTAVVPYAALIYDPTGTTWVYVVVKALSFQRERVTVDRIEGGRVLLSHGPRAGARVVTVGAAEVYGAELEIGSG
jgi:hypothetical protein